MNKKSTLTKLPSNEKYKKIDESVHVSLENLTEFRKESLFHEKRAFVVAIVGDVDLFALKEAISTLYASTEDGKSKTIIFHCEDKFTKFSFDKYAKRNFDVFALRDKLNSESSASEVHIIFSAYNLYNMFLHIKSDKDFDFDRDVFCLKNSNLESVDINDRSDRGVYIRYYITTYASGDERIGGTAECKPDLYIMVYGKDYELDVYSKGSNCTLWDVKSIVKFKDAPTVKEIVKQMITWSIHNCVFGLELLLRSEATKYLKLESAKSSS